MKKKMIKLDSNHESTDEGSEVYALLDVMKAIKTKESETERKEPIKKPKLVRP